MNTCHICSCCCIKNWSSIMQRNWRAWRIKIFFHSQFVCFQAVLDTLWREWILVQGSMFWDHDKLQKDVTSWNFWWNFLWLLIMLNRRAFFSLLSLVSSTFIYFTYSTLLSVLFFFVPLGSHGDWWICFRMRIRPLPCFLWHTSLWVSSVEKL